MIAQAYLENVEVGFSPFYLDLDSGLRIRSVFRDEKARLNQDFFANFDTACVIEQLESAPADLEKAESKVRSVFKALLLFEDRLIRSRRITSMAANLLPVSVSNAGSLVHQSRPLWRHALSASHMFPFKFDSKTKAQKFKAFLDVFGGLQKPEYFKLV